MTQTGALTLYTGGDPVDRATFWKNLPPDERRRRAVQACHEHDATTLWDLTQAWTTLYGAAGAMASYHTRRTYRAGVMALLEAWRSENLLRPSPDAGALWLRHLESAGGRDKEGQPKGLAPATVTVRLAAARSFYNALRWAKATTDDPFRELRAARDSTPRWEKRSPYRPEEIEAMLEVAGDEDRVLLLLGAHAGLRVSECLALTWADIALPRRELIVQNGKGGKKRTVPLSQSLIAALHRIRPRQVSGFVLPYRSDWSARSRVTALAEAAQVPYRGIHALRHACGTRLVTESKGNLEDAARHLGHSSIETTRIYVKWSDEGLRETVARW
jgi:integrase/recombinase XerC